MWQIVLLNVVDGHAAGCSSGRNSRNDTATDDLAIRRKGRHHRRPWMNLQMRRRRLNRSQAAVKFVLITAIQSSFPPQR